MKREDFEMTKNNNVQKRTFITLWLVFSILVVLGFLQIYNVEESRRLYFNGLTILLFAIAGILSYFEYRMDRLKQELLKGRPKGNSD